MMRKTTSEKPRLLSRQGFTLIEVLVALIIVSVGVVSIYSSFISISDTLARMDSHNRSILLALEKMWEVQEALMQPDEFKIDTFSGELKENNRYFKWEFTENDVEDYKSLKEITIKLDWEHGRRKGNVTATTYLKALNTE
ncbi:MAG: prepilin-type N-terminal cleavage/methylation domain-containing protein [Planctomycetes bacterium]|nr:prepilin-type N-terminal cleavage/methylation domain-containing protein [Planctomycetota bacterium]